MIMMHHLLLLSYIAFIINHLTPLPVTAKTWSNLNIDIESEDDSNLFIELPYSEDSSDDDVESNVDVRYFTLLQSSHSVSIKSNYGPISSHKSLYPQHLDHKQTLNNPKLNNSVDNSQTIRTHLENGITNSDISAHLVTKEVRRSSPVLRVLFYARHTSDYSQRSRIDYIEPNQCASIIVQNQGEKLFGSCSPSKSRDGACLVEVTLPVHWWPPVDTTGIAQKQQKSTIAKVSYIITNAEQCNDGSLLFSDHSHLTFIYLSDVALTPFMGSYEEITNDNVVTILIPHEPVYPNSKIYIPVKFTFNPEYPMAAFSLKVRVKTGVRILGAQLSQPNYGKWQISVDVSPKQTIATVIAYMRDFDLQQDSQSVPDDLIDNPSQEVYSWLFEIDDDVDINDSGRIVWQIMYITETSSVKNDFDRDAAKLTSRLDIQKDDILDIIAITRSRQLLNTACLTGRQVSLPMRIYMVSNARRVSDVTLQSSCHAADESILKVSPSCTLVYLDGSEVRGSQNATVIIKYGTFTGYGSFIVWMPKLPLEMKPSDIKLSQIKGWKTPHVKRKHYSDVLQSDSSRSMEDTSARTKSVKHDTDEENNIGNDIGCRLRYQQTRVEVFTKFYSTDHDSGREAYLLSRRVWIKVTHLVMPFLRVSDPKILILRNNIIEGLNIGQSEIQVISPITGHLMGNKKIRVTSDKETLTHMDVRIVSALDLQIKPDDSIPNVWIAKTTLLDKLTSQYQEGLLDIHLHFSDGLSFELSDVTDSDYNLSIDTFDGAVAFAPIAGFYPRVIAIGPGKGQLLHVSLELDNQCQRKRSQPLKRIQPLSMTYVNVNVDFPVSTLQNDAFNYKKSGVLTPKNNSLSINNDLYQDRDNSGQTKSGPTVEAHHTSFVHQTNMTTLKVGIYSIMVIFGVAILIFVLIVVSCSLFAVRFKNKTPPEAVITTRINPLDSGNRPVLTNANDWVWLGKATLERNSIKTQCSEPLIKDLNGNPILREKITSDCGDNRFSGVSFPGSEISIRITSNPNPADDIDDDSDSNSITIPLSMLEENEQITYMINPPVPPRGLSTVGPPIPNRNRHQSKYSTYTKPPPIPPHRNRMNLNEMIPMHSRPPPVPPHQNINVNRNQKSRHTSGHTKHLPSQSNRSSARTNRIAAHPNRVEMQKAQWDKVTKDMNYNQLMDYFENLKESNA